MAEHLESFLPRSGDWPILAGILAAVRSSTSIKRMTKGSKEGDLPPKSVAAALIPGASPPLVTTVIFFINLHRISLARPQPG
jgi:hypothetical protein